MPRRAGVLLLLLTLASIDAARAQLTGVIGAGAASSGRHLSEPDLHALAAVTFPLHGSFGIRAEGLVSEVPGGIRFAASGDIVFGVGDQTSSAKGGYLLAGGSVIVTRGETRGGFNGGIGYGVAVNRRFSVVLESRYMRILGSSSDPSILLLTVELQFPLRAGER
jgi:hypothetical protein